MHCHIIAVMYVQYIYTLVKEEQCFPGHKNRIRLRLFFSPLTKCFNGKSLIVSAPGCMCCVSLAGAVQETGGWMLSCSDSAVLRPLSTAHTKTASSLLLCVFFFFFWSAALSI